jgi:hypothetical protein
MQIKPVKIKVYAGEGMVANTSTLSTTTPRRFVGWKYDAEQKAFVKSDEPEEMVLSKTNRNYYIKMIKEGALLPADKETAELCGLDFIEI